MEASGHRYSAWFILFGLRSVLLGKGIGGRVTCDRVWFEV